MQLRSKLSIWGVEKALASRSTLQEMQKEVIQAEKKSYKNQDLWKRMEKVEMKYMDKTEILFS